MANCNPKDCTEGHTPETAQPGAAPAELPDEPDPAPDEDITEPIKKARPTKARPAKASKKK